MPITHTSCHQSRHPQHPQNRKHHQESHEETHELPKQLYHQKEDFFEEPLRNYDNFKSIIKHLPHPRCQRARLSLPS
jgi:hypothetical protein